MINIVTKEITPVAHKPYLRIYLGKCIIGTIRPSKIEKGREELFINVPGMTITLRYDTRAIALEQAQIALQQWLDHAGLQAIPGGVAHVA